MQRSIDGPDSVWSTVEVAATWLGLTVDELRSEMKAYPHLLPTTKIGKGFKIHWFDLVLYSGLRSRIVETEENEEKRTPRNDGGR